MRMKLILLMLLVLLLPIVGCGAKTTEEPADYVTEPVSGPSDIHESPAETDEPPAVQGLSFLFFSDTQPDPESGDFSGVGKLLVQAVARDEKPELVVFGGDTVNTGNDETEWFDFWQSAGMSLGKLVTAAVAGNHDNQTLLSMQFDHPSEAPFDPGEGWFYSFSTGPVFFIMLDSNIMGAANQTDIEWLENELKSEEATQARWRIAVMHHPMWPLSDIPKDIQRAETMREFFLPVMEEYNVDLILCGHQHVYSRSLPMRGETVATDNPGIVQMMAASGDKSSYTVADRDFIAVSAEAPNYLLLTVNESSINIKAYDGNQKEIDSYRIQK